MDPRQGHLPPSPPKEDPLASLRQRMAEKRAEIDANLSPSARARNGFDDDDAAADDAATDQAFPPQPPPPVSTEPPMKTMHRTTTVQGARKSPNRPERRRFAADSPSFTSS